MTLRELQPWKVSDAVWVFFAGFAGAVIAAAFVSSDGITTREVFAALVPGQMGATILAVVVISPRREQLPLRFASRDSLGLLVGAGLQLGLSLVMGVLITLFFGDDAPTQEIVDQATEALGAGEVGLVVLGAGLLAPLAEELLFRGVLLQALLRRWNERVAYWGSAGAFAVVHLLDPNAILTVPTLFIVGLVLARQALDTGRLGKPILTHVGFNLISVIAIFVTATS
ncbi:MAG: type II CAAX endopeptidase family protein [Acidimicrobiia bacterium]|nr:type II CAAX endopeptidase family protein [Acidimicrobiia bacterium]